MWSGACATVTVVTINTPVLRIDRYNRSTHFLMTQSRQHIHIINSTFSLSLFNCFLFISHVLRILLINVVCLSSTVWAMPHIKCLFFVPLILALCVLPCQWNAECPTETGAAGWQQAGMLFSPKQGAVQGEAVLKTRRKMRVGKQSIRYMSLTVKKNVYLKTQNYICI